MQAVVIFSVPRLKYPGEGPLFELDSNYAGGQNAATIRVIPWAIKSGRGPWPDIATSWRPYWETWTLFDQDWNDLERGHYLSRTWINAAGPKCSHYANYAMNNNVSLDPWPDIPFIRTPDIPFKWTPEQKYLPSDQDCNGLGRGPLFESGSNKRLGAKVQPLFELSHDHYWSQAWSPWADFAPTTGGTPEPKYLPFLSDWDWIGLGRGHYSSWTRINTGGKNAATSRIIPWPIIEVRPRTLAISGRPEQK